MPKVIQVIEAHESRGAGVEGDPCRDVVRYYTLNGVFLAEFDRWETETMPRCPRLSCGALRAKPGNVCRAGHKAGE